MPPEQESTNVSRNSIPGKSPGSNRTDNTLSIRLEPTGSTGLIQPCSGDLAVHNQEPCLESAVPARAPVVPQSPRPITLKVSPCIQHIH